MQCSFPRTIKIKKPAHAIFEFKTGVYKSPDIGYGYMKVPCGKCMNCRISRAREWATRLLHELDAWQGKGLFVTLTYDEEFLPPGGSLDKKELQRFFKRLRRDLNGERIKYFASGEYGDTSNRAHYHAIVYYSCCSNDIKHSIKRCWPLGHIKFGTVTYDSCRYVAGYITKKLNGPAGEAHYNGRTPPFQLQSQGIGLEWAEKNKKYLQNKLGITVKGVEVGLPRYYVKKLDLNVKKIKEESIKRQKCLDEKIIDKYGETKYSNAMIKSNEQRERNVVSRMNLNDRRKSKKL
ncbi:MAG: hypothetical protein FWD14_01150 [Treponema sp.]|nr:hypothetical protein [Treponema sp.]